MEVILTQAVGKLGAAGEIVRVRPGFARNYLFPRGLATEATDAGRRAVEEKRRRETVREERLVQEANAQAERLGKVKLTVAVQAGEDDKLFGSVTTLDIADLLKKEGMEVDRKDILLEEPIRTLGLFSVPVRLTKDVRGTVRLYVVKE